MKKKGELEMAEKKVQNSKLLKRITCIKLRSEGVKNISKYLGVTSDTVSIWIRLYKDQGLSGLLTLNYKGAKSKLNETQKKKLIQRIKEKPFKTAKEAKTYIEKEFNVIYHLNHIHKLLKKLQIKL